MIHILKRTFTKQPSTEDTNPIAAEVAVAKLDTEPVPTQQPAPVSPLLSTQPRGTIMDMNNAMSDNIFDHIMGRGRALDLIETKNDVAMKKSSVRFSVMDSNAEYWDKDGIIRRSESVTRRMNLRGIPIPHATDPKEYMNQVNASIETENSTEKVVPLSSNEKISATAKANRQAKLELLKVVDEKLMRSLSECYSSPRSSNKLALTETQHTSSAPSKLLQYIDADGNVRKLKRDDHDTPRSEPPPTPPPTPV